MASKKFRVVTFQSREVVEQLTRDGIYYADRNKMREGSINDTDVAVCGGRVPVWVFQHPAFKSSNVGVKQMCHLFEQFRCEMSINTLDGLYLLELHLDNQPPVGTAHNSSSLACIIPSIRMCDVAAVYKMKKFDWYFYDVEVISLFAEDVLFHSGCKFRADNYDADKSPLIKLSNYKSVTDYYKDCKVKSSGIFCERVSRI